MKELKKYNLADRYYVKKLQTKVMNGLKDQTIKSASKLENAYKFILKREKGQYFRAIR